MRSEIYFPADETKESVARLMPREAVAPVENETQSVLRRALALLGPNGEYWCKRSGGWVGPRFCVEGAIMRVTKLNDAEIIGTPAYIAFSDAAGSVVPWAWNDFAKDFSEVRAMFLRAIELAA